MRNKRLIILFSVFAALVLIIVIGSAFFSLKGWTPYFVNEFNEHIDESALIAKYGGFDLEKSVSDFKGKSVFFLDRNGLVLNVERDYRWLKVVKTEIVFPSTIKLTATERVPVFHFALSGSVYYCDKWGFVITDKKPDRPTIEVVSEQFSALNAAVGIYLTSARFLKTEFPKSKLDAASGVFLSCADADITMETVNSLWRQYDEAGNQFSLTKIPSVIKSLEFGADESGNKKLTIMTLTDAKIVVFGPEADMFEKFTAAYGAYANASDGEKTFSVGYNKNSNGNYVVVAGP